MVRSAPEIVATIAELLRQQIDVLTAAKLGTVSEHDLAAYHSRDLEIRYLFDELNGERIDREPILMRSFAARQ